ncbi:MAG TPA: hypothetical protein VM282_25615 [Acidimicrobiales bacterium]|nr:hypothetical protein [Acidimicrobiales bacterium]
MSTKFRRLFALATLLVLAACGATEQRVTATSLAPAPTTPPSSEPAPTMPAPTTTVTAASPPAVALVDGRLVTFSTVDGQQTGVQYDSAPGIVGSFSIRRTSGGIEAYATLESPDRCQPRIYRIVDGRAHDTGIVGAGPEISPDGALLAYEKDNLTRIPVPGFCPWRDLVVRDLSTGVERAWTIPSAQYVRWLAWSSDSRQAVIHLGAEAYSGDTFVLDTSSAPAGDLRSVRTPVPGLQAREWIGRPMSVADGVFVAIYCCREPNEGVGIAESIQFGVVSASGQLRRIATTKDRLERVLAVDPSASYILLHDSNNLIRADIDGTNRVSLGGTYENVLW